jgi:hypothetical protein
MLWTSYKNLSLIVGNNFKEGHSLYVTANRQYELWHKRLITSIIFFCIRQIVTTETRSRAVQYINT